MIDFYAIGAEYATKFDDREAAWEYALNIDQRVIDALANDAGRLVDTTHQSDLSLSEVTPHLSDHSWTIDAAENFARGFYQASQLNPGELE
jgi:hypothetical protein